MVFLYITCKDTGEARIIAKELISKKLAACANILPIQSVYCDGDNQKEVAEAAMIIKTVDSRVQEAEKIIRGIHSYKTPCIATFSLSRLNREYKEWLIGNVA